MRLAGAEVAHAVEALATIAPARPVTTLRAGSASDAERAARSCYDHLAGSLGVAITDRLCALGALDRDDLHLRDPSALARLGVDVDALASDRGRRPLTRPCLDWSERRHHLAGRAGAGMLDALLAHDWLRRRAGSRALTTTERGRAAFREVLGLEL